MNSHHTTVGNSDSAAGVPLPKPIRAEHASVQGVMQVSSQTIFSGAQEVEIDHNGTLYRLRQTSLGKLILTK